jgi:hypothetical protein
MTAALRHSHSEIEAAAIQRGANRHELLETI